MEDNNKLFVFEKKEILLIFLFVILIAIISFTLGVRTGKSLSLKSDQFSSSDINQIDLKSVDEEYVDTVVPSTGKTILNESAAKVDDQGAMESRLKEEMEKLATQDIDLEELVQDQSGVDVKIEKKEIDKSTELPDSRSVSEGRDFSGKYTIQLFAHQSQEVSQDFADGFLVKGYDVIINEASIPGKGKWYRVSIGVFSSQNEAKDYLDKEKNLFQSQDYVIKQF